jgi:hypothetical protein
LRKRYCDYNLLLTHKIFQVPSGTKAQVLGFRDNPYRARLLTGALVQVRILEGAFRGQVMWTLEDRIAKLSRLSELSRGL